MSETTAISWTHHTFNPWSGCAKVSAGCAHCYAADLPPAMRRFAEWGANGTRIPASESYWREPLKWARKSAAAGERRRVFCASVADVFEDRADLDAYRERLWALIEATPDLDWLLLTKRPEKMAAWAERHGWPVNAWAGVSVENQSAAADRIPHLLRVPARVRFLSCEPLLGAVDLLRWIGSIERCDYCGDERPAPIESDYCPECDRFGGLICVSGEAQAERLRSGERYNLENPLGVLDCDGGWPEHIDWVIVGGESGRHARPMHPDWVRGLRDQCEAANVQFHFKQWGVHAPVGDGRGGTMAKVGKHAAGRLLDGRIWDEFPVVDR